MKSFGRRIGGGRRGSARMAAPLTAVITTLRESRSAILVDVSATGAKLRGPDLPGLSEELFLTVDGVIAFGTIAWESKAERGVVFDAPLRAVDEARLRRKVARAEGLSQDLRAAFDDWAQGFSR